MASPRGCWGDDAEQGSLLPQSCRSFTANSDIRRTWHAKPNRISDFARRPAQIRRRSCPDVRLGVRDVEQSAEGRRPDGRECLEFVDDPVDAAGQSLDVIRVDGREHRDPQLVASELAVWL